MRITNAIIRNVAVGINEVGSFSARMTFESQARCWTWCFILSDPIDVQRFIKLMNYVGVYEVIDLNGKVIREVDSCGFLRGFGHSIDDKFIPILTDEFMEISEKEFIELLKK